MSDRYAIYFAPEKDSALDSFGKRWIGRCSETGQKFDQPELTVLSHTELYGLTELPRHYGFHGTLTPPFPLKDGVSPEQLMARVRSVTEGFEPFVLEPLSVQLIGNFFALVPAGQTGVARLADACVRSFHPLRMPPTLAQMEKRRARGLTPIQERLLVNWGYPYVMEEFRFHLTLTGPVRDKGLRRQLGKSLTKYAESVCRMIHWVRDLSVFYQPDEAAPFALVHRIPLGK